MKMKKLFLSLGGMTAVAAPIAAATACSHKLTDEEKVLLRSLQTELIGSTTDANGLLAAATTGLTLPLADYKLFKFSTDEKDIVDTIEKIKAIPTIATAGAVVFDGKTITLTNKVAASADATKKLIKTLLTIYLVQVSSEFDGTAFTGTNAIDFTK